MDLKYPEQFAVPVANMPEASRGEAALLLTPREAEVIAAASREQANTKLLAGEALRASATAEDELQTLTYYVTECSRNGQRADAPPVSLCVTRSELRYIRGVVHAFIENTSDVVKELAGLGPAYANRHPEERWRLARMGLVVEASLDAHIETFGNAGVPEQWQPED